MDGFIDWLWHEPHGLREWLIFGFRDALIFCLLLAVLLFALLGRNPAKVMYDRTYTAVENTTLGSAWKFLTFIKGENTMFLFWGTYIVLLISLENMQILIASVICLAVAWGFAPPHNVLNWKVKILVSCGAFLLTLIYLKCGGLQGHYHQAMFVAGVAHFIPSSIITIAYERERRRRKKERDNAPIPFYLNSG